MIRATAADARQIPPVVGNDRRAQPTPSERALAIESVPEMVSRICIALVLLVGAFPVLAQQAAESIGTQGATLELTPPWKRQVIEKDLGPDQFTAIEPRGLFGGGSMVYAVVVEVLSHVESDEDFRRVLDDHATEGRDAKIDVVREPGRRRAVRAFDTRLNGIDVAMHCEVIAADGLAYHFLTWALKSQRSLLTKRVAELRDGLEFPDVRGSVGLPRRAKRS